MAIDKSHLIKNFGNKRNTNGFDKNKQNIGTKPKKLLNGVVGELKALGYKAVSKEEILETYLTLVNLTEEDLLTLMKDENTPVSLKVLIKGLSGKKGFDILEKILDRGIGKPLQQIKSTEDVTLQVNGADLLSEIQNGKAKPQDAYELLKQAKAISTIKNNITE